MIQTNWIDRPFHFDFPVGMWPVLLARLEGTTHRIQGITENLSPEELIVRDDEQWSIQQHIGHLIDLEELHTGRIEDYKQHQSILRAADMSNNKTEKADHNKRSLDELMRAFATARKNFIDQMLLFSDDELSNSALHPRLQMQMRVVDLAYFVAEHDDHHLAKMMTIKNALKKTQPQL